MIRIHCPGKTIILSAQKELFRKGQDSLLLNVRSAEELKASFQESIGKKKLKTIFYCHPDESLLLEFFSSMFRMIRAAGGLVQNTKGEYLFIFRHGKWDLPKGKIEKGEDVRQAAMREVEEECGVSGLTEVRELLTTYHTYSQGGEQVLKPTHWFRMLTADNSVLVPQTEEGITAVKWLAFQDLEMVRENTFPSILEVIEHC